MHIPVVSYALNLVKTGHTKFLLAEIWMHIYKPLQEFKYWLKHQVFGALPGPQDFKIHLQTNHPVAYESPDHKIPFGTMRDNSTNKKFVEFMAARIQGEAGEKPLGALDLGCSGGQLVRDFYERGWLATGLEGSDFSKKHGRANWPALGGKNLFTCDITKPFQITTDGKPAQFHLITMWEVLEHIPEQDLPALFANINKHLHSGGYFIATTTSAPDVHDGVDLHQTKWPNDRWKSWLSTNVPTLASVDLGLKFYQYVRHNAEGSFLTLRKK